jgi:uncharacterized damage-inducible protein DinB
MTFYGGREMAASLRTVRANTMKIAEEIPEDQYSFRPTPESRTIGQLLVHVAVGPAYQLHIHRSGIADLRLVDFPQLMQAAAAEEARPRTKADIIELLLSRGEEFASYLESLTDEFLAEPVAMPPGAQPPAKSRFEMLLSPKEHEMHHRGQLMLIERMIGIVPHLTRALRERVAARAAAPAQA